MEECKRMGTKVLGPEINESSRAFSVNKRGEIRFGLGAIKGTGDAAVDSIISERKANGEYKDIFDFLSRVNSRTVNKKTLESLAYAGAFDGFGINRKAFFEESDGAIFLEKLIRYGNKAAEEANAAQVSLFGEAGGGSGQMPTPKIPEVEDWSALEKLKYEKDVVGIFISGHPLDQFKLELDTFCTSTLDQMMEFKNKDVAVAGIVTKVNERFSKNGKPFVIFSIEDYSGAQEIALFGEDYIKFNQYIEIDRFLYIKGQIKPRWNQADNFELKIGSIHLLAEIRQKMSKELKVSMRLEHVNQSVTQKLKALFEEHKGNIPLTMALFEMEEKVELTMISRKIKINPSNELLEQLTDIDGLMVKLT